MCVCVFFFAVIKRIWCRPFSVVDEVCHLVSTNSKKPIGALRIWKLDSSVAKLGGSDINPHIRGVLGGPQHNR